MKAPCALTAVAAAAVLTGAAQAGIVAEWEVESDLAGEQTFRYEDEARGIDALNSNFDITNLNGLSLIGVSFTILPTEGETYGPDEFESIVFDIEADTGDDTDPWVPPSLLNPTPFTVTPSNDNGFGPQTITFDFPTAPLDPGETLQARFQIEWPTNALFDVLISPIVIPTPAALGIFAAAGLVGGSRRRRG